MASLTAALCVVVLSACAVLAERPSRQFEELKPEQAVCMQDGVSYPIGASVPDDDPCTFGCFCGSPGNIICAVVKSPRSCAFMQPPCVDAVYVNDPTQCCPYMTCPNGPNCQAGDQIIPAGQTVEVDGAQCRCDGMLSVCSISISHEVHLPQN
ncbi:von Willebrand factor C domain-containing protein 2-like [Branchiostoma lanceolatum]|uniref:von Willebrand factor C domain-containing protein 2-like n=1 Tax=Branchiostoma lanceolatum TaxID=7740 RepID=UPI0034528B70